MPRCEALDPAISAERSKPLCVTQFNWASTVGLMVGLCFLFSKLNVFLLIRLLDYLWYPMYRRAYAGSGSFSNI